MSEPPSSPPPHHPPPSGNPYQQHNPYFPQGNGPAYSPYQLGPNGIPLGPPPDHPQATTVLILGILGFALCQVVSPFAWAMGSRVMREIDASGGSLGGRSNAKVGYVLGIVGSCILLVGALGVLAYLGVLVAVLAGSST